jgi:hypothetical protein
VERLDPLKSLILRGYSALHLAFSSVPLDTQDLLPPEPIICSVEDINQRYGVKLHANFNPEISARFKTLRQPFVAPNLEATNEMICAVSEGLDKLPNPRFYINNIIFFPYSQYAEGLHLRDPFEEQENWIVIYYRQSQQLQQEVIQGAQERDNLHAPNYYVYLQHILAHEAGHGLIDVINYLSSTDEIDYQERSKNSVLDRNHPLFRTFAEVVGFEFVEPIEICDEESCQPMVVYETVKLNGTNTRLRRNGWIKKADSLENAPITNYEQRRNDPNESIPEYFRAYTFNPSLLDENQLDYFNRLINGLESDDPYGFMQSLVADPEGVLLNNSY